MSNLEGSSNSHELVGDRLREHERTIDATNLLFAFLTEGREVVRETSEGGVLSRTWSIRRLGLVSVGLPGLPIPLEEGVQLSATLTNSPDRPFSSCVLRPFVVAPRASDEELDEGFVYGNPLAVDLEAGPTEEAAAQLTYFRATLDRLAGLVVK